MADSTEPMTAERLDEIERLTKANGVTYAPELIADIKRQRTLLTSIRQWDVLDVAADGPFWKREIDKALGVEAVEPAKGAE